MNFLVLWKIYIFIWNLSHVRNILSDNQFQIAKNYVIIGRSRKIKAVPFLLGFGIFIDIKYDIIA